MKTVLISKQGAKDSAHLEKLMPVLVRPRQPTHLQSQDDAYVIETNFRQQTLEPESSLDGCPAQALILIDDLNLCGCPTEIDGSVDE